MPISIKKLKELADERGYKNDTQTVKISDYSHPYGAEERNQSLEINYSSQGKEWIGFSFNTDNREKLEYAIKEQPKIESFLESYKKKDGSTYELLHLKDDKTFKSKGIPGQKNSYVFYCIKCPASPSFALEILEKFFKTSGT
tara:strand:- start:3817 stop:4242 length:426 start_codon:yes stop_codon:yes gene_type:complete